MEDKKDEQNEVSEITKFNETSGSFALLADEPETYSWKDLKVVYPKPTD